MASSLDFSAQSFGATGQATIQQMHLLLSTHALGLSYDPSSKKFTVLNSASLKKEEIEQFLQNSYEGWEPCVLNELDGRGNHLVRLMSIIEDRSSKAHRTFSRELSYKPLGFIRFADGGYERVISEEDRLSFDRSIQERYSKLQESYSKWLNQHLGCMELNRTASEL